MSLKGVLEFVLNIESYYIVEYPYQGLFYFSTSIYQLKDGKKTYAIPYQILTNTNPEPHENPDRLIVEALIEDQKGISTKALAKYSDQGIVLDNWFTYRMELQGYPEFQSENIFMEVSLIFNHKNVSEPESQGELIETVTFRVNDIQNGIFSYVEAHFKAPYLSRLNFTLFGHLASFKFSKYDCLKKQPSKQDIARTKIKSTEQLSKLSASQLPKQLKVQQVFYTNYVKKLRISQYLILQRMNSILLEPKQNIDILLPDQYIKSINCQKITTKEFKEYLDNFYPSKLTIQLILREINEIRLENFNLQQTIIHDWMDNKFNHQKLIAQFDTFGKEKYGQVVFKSVITAVEESKKPKSYHENKKIARQMRGKNIVINNYPIEDVRFVQKREQQQLIFYEVTLRNTEQEIKQTISKLKQEEAIIRLEGAKIQYSQKHMLVVLCHGYQGSSFDMALIKRWIQVQLPEAYYLVSRCNEYDTDGDIKKMGKNLAEQIQKFIENYMEQYEQENVIINLVGHSMGGVIARSALPHLQKYKNHMGFFCSLSSPHLGYLNGVSGLIKVGLWAIRKFKNIESLSQLEMGEKGDPRKTFLYELSRTGHLRYFRKVILLSSYEDSYVSWHSARITPHRSGNSMSKVEEQMCYNMLGNNIFNASIHRIDINFNVRQKTLDSFLGRTAHINLIIRENLFKTLSITIPKLFDMVEFGRDGLFV